MLPSGRGKPESKEVELLVVNNELKPNEPMSSGSAKHKPVRVRQPVAAPTNTTTEPTMATLLIETWIKTQLKVKKHAELIWWGNGFSDKIRTIGRAIGKQYEAEVVAGKKIIVAEYRIDWDEIIGAHFNVNIISSMGGVNEKKGYVLRFGTPPQQVVVASDEAKATKPSKPTKPYMQEKSASETEVIKFSYFLTNAALNHPTHNIPMEFAAKFLRYAAMCVEGQSYHKEVATYFNEFPKKIRDRLFLRAQQVVSGFPVSEQAVSQVVMKESEEKAASNVMKVTKPNLIVMPPKIVEVKAEVVPVVVKAVEQKIPAEVVVTPAPVTVKAVEPETPVEVVAPVVEAKKSEVQDKDKCASLILIDALIAEVQNYKVPTVNNRSALFGNSVAKNGKDSSKAAAQAPSVSTVGLSLTRTTAE